MLSSIDFHKQRKKQKQESNTTKKFLAVLISILTLSICFAMPAYADNSDFIIENGVLTSYRGSGGNVVIPDGVTEIGEWAFAYCSNLTSITIPDSVTEIGECAFYDCSGLTTINILNSVTEIGYAAFAYCTTLTAITIPDSVTTIGDNAFYGCYKLKKIVYSGTQEQWNSITIGSTNSDFTHAKLTFVFEISDGILTKYNGLESEVVIPDGVSEIGEEAFADCTSLKKVTMEGKIDEIGENAFKNTPWQTTRTLVTVGICAAAGVIVLAIVLVLISRSRKKKGAPSAPVSTPSVTICECGAENSDTSKFCKN